MGPEQAGLSGAASGGDRSHLAWKADVLDEIAASQVLPKHSEADQLHHVDGVHGVRALFVTVAELIETALHVFPADLGEYPLVACAHPCPERFDPVHVGHAADMLAGRVVDRLPAAVEIPVSRALVRHDDALGMGDVLGEAPHVPHAPVRDHLGGDLSGRPVPRPDNHDLVLRRAAYSFPVALVPVRLQTAKAGLVDLEGHLVWRKILGDGERPLGAVLVGLAQAVAEKPCAFLDHAEIAAQVKRGVPRPSCSRTGACRWPTACRRGATPS